MVLNMDVKTTVLWLGLACSLGWTGTIVAANRISLQPGILQFQYEETDNDGSFLDGETGVIPGFKATVNVRATNNSELVFGISQYSDDVKYNGQTQAGFPHQTRTDEMLRSLSAAIVLSLPELNGSLYLKAGVGRGEWERDIMPANGVSGLYERYSWYELNAGLGWLIYRSDAEEYRVYATMSRTVKPRIKVDLTPWDYGKPSLELKERSGFEIGTDWIYSINNRWQFGMALSYKIRRFGHSNEITLVNGMGASTIMEPDSETKLTSFQLMLINLF